MVGYLARPTHSQFQILPAGDLDQCGQAEASLKMPVEVDLGQELQREPDFSGGCGQSRGSGSPAGTAGDWISA